MIPLSVSRLVRGMIVLPNEEQEGSKGGGGDKSEDRSREDRIVTLAHPLF